MTKNQIPLQSSNIIVGDELWTIHWDIFTSETRTLEHYFISETSRHYGDI